MRTWEYKLLTASGQAREIQDSLNRAGAEGWELVQVQGMVIYFKRLLDRPAAESKPGPGPRKH